MSDLERSRKKSGFSLGLACCLVLVGSSLAAEEVARSHLLGDWSGHRTELERQGIRFELVLTSELIQNVSGGVEQDRALLGNLDLIAQVDSEEAGLWSGGTFLLYALGNFRFGEQPSALVGDIQVTSNIEAPECLKIYQAWYEHSFLEGAMSALLGLHDYNSEFDSLAYAGLFRNSSFGMSPDISQVGPSIFPATSVGARIKVRPGEKLYLLGAAYDGVPGEPEDPCGWRISLDRDEGLFYAAEMGFSFGEPFSPSRFGKLAVGGWYSTRDFRDFQGIDRGSNFGLYAIGERALFREADGHQGLGAFLQVGVAHEECNEISSYLGGGLAYKGMFPGRPSDIFGFAVGSPRQGSAFLQANPGLSGKETVLEFTYQAEVVPWLWIQPDVQYIIQPSSEPDLKNALQLGLTWQLSF